MTLFSSNGSGFSIQTPRAIGPTQFCRSTTPRTYISTHTDPSADTTAWSWEPSGRFSTSSAYKVLHNRGIICPFSNRLWKIKAPPKVRVFIWVMSQNKLLTREVLCKRDCGMILGCTLCHRQNLEDARHLLWECLYAQALWGALFILLQLPPIPSATSGHICLWQSRPSLSLLIWDIALGPVAGTE